MAKEMKERLEGSGASQLVSLMKHFGHNDSFLVELGTVETPMPDLSIKLDGKKFILDKDFLMITDSAKSKLVKGDIVLVLSIEENQTYIIIDKVVAV